MALWTQDDIDQLKAAIASLTLTVSYGSGANHRSRTYQSLSEMRKLLGEMVRDVSGTANRRLVKWNKGFR